MFYLGIILPRLPLLTDMTSFYSIRRPLIGVLSALNECPGQKKKLGKG